MVILWFVFFSGWPLGALPHPPPPPPPFPFPNFRRHLPKSPGATVSPFDTKATTSTSSPLFFLHGIGVGLLPYLPLIRRLAAGADPTTAEKNDISFSESIRRAAARMVWGSSEKGEERAEMGEKKVVAGSGYARDMFILDMPHVAMMPCESVASMDTKTGVCVCVVCAGVLWVALLLDLSSLLSWYRYSYFYTYARLLRGAVAFHRVRHVPGGSSLCPCKRPCFGATGEQEGVRPFSLLVPFAIDMLPYLLTITCYSPTHTLLCNTYTAL